MSSQSGVEGQPDRQFGWWDMFVHPDDDPRTDGRYTGERETLSTFLRDYRLTLRMKCDGLDAAQLARRSVEPSDLSLLGLVRHLSGVERFWIRIVMAGEDVSRLRDEEAFGGAVPDPKVVADSWAGWEEEVRYAERFVEQATDLGVTGTTTHGPIELRQVLVHLIEEYARHCGHADLLRERIDGRVGQ